MTGVTRVTHLEPHGTTDPSNQPVRVWWILNDLSAALGERAQVIWAQTFVNPEEGLKLMTKVAWS